MKIGGFRKCSEVDFPGRTAAVVFLQGCNWRCPYCRTASLVVPQCFNDPIPEEEVLRYLRRNRSRIRSVVITGGEPTIHADLPEFLAKLRALKLAIKLDTNGSQPDMLREVFRDRLVDYVAMDVKAPLRNYAQAVGKQVDVEAVRASIFLVKNAGVAHEFRTTVVPGLHTLNEIKELSNLVRGADYFVLQGYDSSHASRDDFRNRVGFTRKSLEGMRKHFTRKVKRFEVRGTEHAASEPEIEAADAHQIAV